MSAHAKRWLAVALVALAALTLETGRERARVAPPSPVPSVDNPGPEGLEAAYLYLLARGQARTLDAPFTAIPPTARVLLTAEPYARPVEPEEQAALMAWVERGGTLVVMGTHAHGLAALSGVLDPAFVALHLDDRDIGLAELGRDMRALLDSAQHTQGLDVIPARPALEDPLLLGVRALAVGPGRGFDAPGGDAVPLLLAGDTPVLLALSKGSGRILVLAGADALTNARIDLGGNLQFLANLAALGPVLFDAHHHQEAPRAALAALAGSFGPPVLAGLLGVLCLALATSRRLGPVLTGAVEYPRSARDYAVQLGRLYRRARAEPALAGELLSGLRARALRRCHLPAFADDARLAEALAASVPGIGERYAALTARLRDASKGPLGPRDFASLAREAASLAHAL